MGVIIPYEDFKEHWHWSDGWSWRQGEMFERKHVALPEAAATMDGYKGSISNLPRVLEGQKYKVAIMSWP